MRTNTQRARLSNAPKRATRHAPSTPDSHPSRFAHLHLTSILLASTLALAFSTPAFTAQNEQRLGLVEVQRTDQDRFAEIAISIATQKCDEAAESLHGIMTSSSVPGYYPDANDPQRHGNTIEAACRVLGSLPAAALQTYGQRHDAPAAEQLDRATIGGNVAALESVATRYFHTPAGAAAAQSLASSAFDHGRFLDAGTAWEKLYREHTRLKEDRATILAKACTAYHLAGARNQTRDLVRIAETNHAADQIAIAGKNQPLIVYLKNLLGQEPAFAVAPLAPSDAWSSMAGNNRALAIMPDCDATPIPLPVDPPDTKELSSSDLPAQLTEYVTGSDARQTVAREAGRIRVTKPLAEDTKLTLDIAPLAHPIIVNDLILCRRVNSLVAVATKSARELWRTKGMPLYEPRRGSAIQTDAYLALAGDMGRNILTAGDGKVYCLGRFNPVGSDGGNESEDSTQRQASGSTLYALSIGDKGTEESWAVGNGRGGTDWLRTAKFLTAPALDRDRLYTLMRQGNRYVAVCLDASTGNPVWMTTIGLVPMRDGAELSKIQAFALELVTERGTPPAVADGMVFFLTNAGIVTALDANTGAPLWAHRYDSITGGSLSKPSIVTVQGCALRLVTMRRPLPPVNPIIVMQDRLVCLPCDSGNVIALHARSGRPLWRLDRAGQDDLTAVDHSRLLLSGPDLTLVRASDGQVTHRSASRILGRPAVTATKVLASGEGALVTLNLPSLSPVEMPVRETNCVLGSMVVAGGRLFAANAAGLGAFMNYRDAVSAIQAEMARTEQAASRVALGLDLWQLALSCGRLAEASSGLTALLPDAQKSGNPDAVKRARSLLYQSCLAQSRSAASLGEQERFLDQALQNAVTADERIAVLDERARMLERAGGQADAVRLLQGVVERFAGNNPPSEAAAVSVATVREAWFARRELTRLVRRHGDAIYEPFDTAMAVELAAAGQDEAKILRACAKWPCAKRTPEALLATANAAFQKAVSASTPSLTQAMRAARLAAAARDLTRGEASIQGLAAETIIDVRFRPRAARALANRLTTIKSGASTSAQTLRRDTPVAFAGFSGTAADLASLATTNGWASFPPSDAEFGFVSTPLCLLYERAGAPVEVLGDSHGRHLRCGDLIFLSGEEDLVCLDTQSSDYDSAQLWRIELPQPVDRLPRIGQITADGAHLAVYDRNTIWLLDIASGRLLRTYSPDWLGARGWIAAAGEDDWLAVSDGKDTIAGLRLSDGAKLWEVKVRKTFFDNLIVYAGIILAYDKLKPAAMLFDLRSGRVLTDDLLPERAAKGSAATLTPDGLALVLNTNGTVSVRDAWAPRGEGSRTVALGDQGWRPLGQGSGFAAFDMRNASGPVRVLDLSDFNRTVELAPGPTATLKRLAHAAVFHGNRAFLVLTDVSAKGDVLSPALAAYDLPSGKMLWSSDLAPGVKGPCRVTPPEVYGNAVSLAVAAIDEPSAGRQLVFRIEDGAVFDCRAETRVAHKVMAGAGSPVVANGRVFIADSVGVSCLAIVE